jgi:hypothetical protein
MSMRLLPTLMFLVAAVPAAAQTSTRQTTAAEVSGGYAGFVDESFIGHSVAGASARIHLSPRISVGPEIVYMRGPGFDRDLFFTGNLTFDLIVPPVEARRGTVNPFLVAGRRADAAQRPLRDDDVHVIGRRGDRRRRGPGLADRSRLRAGRAPSGVGTALPRDRRCRRGVAMIESSGGP